MLDISSCCRSILCLRGRRGINREVIMLLYSMSQGLYHGLGLCHENWLVERHLRLSPHWFIVNSLAPPRSTLGPVASCQSYSGFETQNFWEISATVPARGHPTRHKYLNFLILKFIPFVNKGGYSVWVRCIVIPLRLLVVIWWKYNDIKTKTETLIWHNKTKDPWTWQRPVTGRKKIPPHSPYVSPPIHISHSSLDTQYMEWKRSLLVHHHI